MPTELREIISASLGRIPFTLLVENARIVNVFTGEILKDHSIGIYKETIVYVGKPESKRFLSKKRLDAKGQFAIPGLIDTHLHVESSMMTPQRFASAILPHGTTTIFADPHEIVNVLGKRGLWMMLENAKGHPMKIYFFAPTCVPESSAVTAGGEILPGDLEEMLEWEGVAGLGEVMDYNAVLSSEERMIRILEIGRKKGAVIDGHSPLLKGRELSAYVSSGPEADHENFEVDSAIEKMRSGMYVKLRGPDVLDTNAFVSKIMKLPSPWNLILVTDDVMPDRLALHGHLDNVCRSAIKAGMDPIEAIRSATLRPAQHMRMPKLGAIAPGRFADIVLLPDLKEFVPDCVISNGLLAARAGKMLLPALNRKFDRAAFNTLHIRKLALKDFLIQLPLQSGNLELNCVEFSAYSRRHKRSQAAFLEMVLTRLARVQAEAKDGRITTPGISTVCVFERHGKGGGQGFGFAHNLMKTGALASTVAHDAHNLMVVGTDSHDMLKASKLVMKSRGGVAAVKDGKVLAQIELPIAGLMCEEPVKIVAKKMEKLRRAFQAMGMIDHPYMPIPFLLSLSVIPHARITDKGVFDVDAQRFVSPFLPDQVQTGFH